MVKTFVMDLIILTTDKKLYIHNIDYLKSYRAVKERKNDPPSFCEFKYVQTINMLCVTLTVLPMLYFTHGHLIEDLKGIREIQ